MVDFNGTRTRISSRSSCMRLWVWRCFVWIAGIVSSPVEVGHGVAETNAFFVCSILFRPPNDFRTNGTCETTSSTWPWQTRMKNENEIYNIYPEWCTQTHKHTNNTQTHKHTNTQTHKHTNLSCTISVCTCSEGTTYHLVHRTGIHFIKINNFFFYFCNVPLCNVL